MRSRKMKSYCLTGEDAITPTWMKSHSYEECEGVPRSIVKKERKEAKIMRKAEIHKTRQRSKARIRKEIQKYLDND